MPEGLRTKDEKNKMKTTYERQINSVIDLISISARTAPKSGGIDDVVFLSTNNQQKNKIVKEMIRIGTHKAKAQPTTALAKAVKTSWSSDAQTVFDSQALILIGVNGKKPFEANCGGCGYNSCADFRAHSFRKMDVSISGPFCIFKIWDLGIAVASAAKIASMLNVDNRIMYRIGIAALKTKILNISPILGLPLSISGKNIYFDRLDKLEAAKTLKDYYSKHA